MGVAKIGSIIVRSRRMSVNARKRAQMLRSIGSGAYISRSVVFSHALLYSHTLCCILTRSVVFSHALLPLLLMFHVSCI